jgi:TetR/AcrR family transcriptional repressor of nem operon
MTPAAQVSSRTRLLDAATQVVRTKGYCATTVDDICQQASVTKGSFFHHFKSKDDLALATIEHWCTSTTVLFANAAYRKARDPLDRLLGYLEFRAGLLTGELYEYTCLLGTLVQEVYDTHPDIRAACDRALSSHIAELAGDVQAAKSRYAPSAPWHAESVGLLIQSVLQGSFIFAKAQQRPAVVRDNLDHLRRYLVSLFPRRARAN